MFVHTDMLYQKWTQNYKQTLSNFKTDLAADIYKTQSDFLLYTYFSASHLLGHQSFPFEIELEDFQHCSQMDNERA